MATRSAAPRMAPLAPVGWIPHLAGIIGIGSLFGLPTVGGALSATTPTTHAGWVADLKEGGA